MMSPTAARFHALATTEVFQLDRPDNPPAEDLFLSDSPALMAYYNEHLRVVLHGALDLVAQVPLIYQIPYVVRYTTKRPSLHLHTDNSAWTCVVFLNDDFKGGELVFPSLKAAFKPPAGCCVAFPGGELYPHYSAEVSSGHKYALVLMTKAG